MANMKYIIFRNKLGHKIPIIFSSSFTHKEFASKFSDMVPFSAGQFSCDTERVSMCGDAFTLGIKSDPGDIDILRRHADFYV